MKMMKKWKARMFDKKKWYAEYLEFTELQAMFAPRIKTQNVI